MLFKPMLAGTAVLEKLRFPLLASAKLDGIRAVVRDGVVYSRSNKPIPNKHVQKLFGKHEYHDGELIVGDPRSKSCYRDTMSGVMTEDGEPDVKLYVFDHVQYPTLGYVGRIKHVETSNYALRLEQHIVTCHTTLLALETELLEAGYEGLILRDPAAPYKYGRSTVNEEYLLKLKRFLDAEAEVIGFEERMHNGNESVLNELGQTSRSTHQANKTGRGDLGALVVSFEGKTFNIGTGFDDAERNEIWRNKTAYLGKTTKFKYFPIGAKDLPRHPVFLGWRHHADT